MSEALIFASTNPQYDDRLFIELQVQYMKIPSSNLGRTCCVRKLFLTFRTISVHNTFSPCSEKRRASDKDLPVYVVSFIIDIPHCTVCKMQHNLEGISCPERGFVPNVTLLRYFFFFSKSKHTMFKCYESERYNSISNTNPAFFSKCPNYMKDKKKFTKATTLLRCPFILTCSNSESFSIWILQQSVCESELKTV